MSEDQEKAMVALENREQSESSSDDHNPEMSAFALESLKNNSFEPTDTDIEKRINKVGAFIVGFLLSLKVERFLQPNLRS